MSNFNKFKTEITKQFNKMTVLGELYTVATNADDSWELYLSSFKEGDNKIFRTRSEYDCQCCRRFIKSIANVVALNKDGTRMSLWDIEVPDEYKSSVAALKALVHSSPVNNLFRHYEAKVGVDANHQAGLNEDDPVIKWEHFYLELPSKYVMPNGDIASFLGKVNTTNGVFKRGLETLTQDSLKTVIDLAELETDPLYRGQEHLASVKAFLKAKVKYDTLDADTKELFIWEDNKYKGFRNSVIGTLVTDLSEGMDTEDAVKRFESKVAPSNYKRTTAIISPAMTKRAEETVVSLGLESALSRRYANIDDINVNDVIFMDKGVKESKGIFGDLVESLPIDTKKLLSVKEVSIDEFVKDILPTATSIELLLENKNTGNLMSLVAPTDPTAGKLFKWANGFSFSYKGDVADSMKDQVAKAGGNVTGFMRFSIRWNDGELHNSNDFDAHCKEPNHLISYINKRSTDTNGFLDVDIMHTNKGTPVVENIAWQNKAKLTPGTYEMLLHNYSGLTSADGFSAQIELDGDVYDYTYAKKLKGKSNIKVADVTWDGSEFKIKHHLKDSSRSVDTWGVATQQYHKVNLVLNSPNYWDDEAGTGNKHWFFILDNCVNPDDTRGFYNEFLNGALSEHRKVFEVLGAKMKAPYTDNQLSGLGFSSTLKDSVICKVNGTKPTVIKVNF